jgi:hypothetical protein
MNALQALVVLLGLIVAPTGAAPTRGRSAVAERSASKRIGRLPKLVPRVGALSPTPPPGTPMQLRKGVALHTYAVAGNKLSLSAAHSVHGPAFMIAFNADVVPVDAPGVMPRGVHVRAGGNVLSLVTREWVGARDLVVESNGELPEDIRVSAMLMADLGFYDVGHMTVSTNNGRVKFALLTADVAQDANYISIQVGNASIANGFRLDGCTLERT